VSFNRSDVATNDPSATAQGALNHVDMLEKIRDMAINQSAVGSSLAVASGGSGYAVGDAVEVTDGASSETFPSSHPTTRATIEVTAVSAGVVTGVRLRNAGVYTALPTNNGTPGEYNTTALSGAGTGLTVDLTFATNGWTVERQTSEVASAAVAAAGSGYVNSESVTLVDSGQERVAATATIAVTAGAITGFTITDGGVYDILTATLTVAGGSGTGGQATPTYSAVTDQTVERELIMSASSGATIVGFRSASNGAYFTLELAGLPAYNAASSFAAQANISPGRYDIGNGHGSFLFLRDTDPARFSWFLNITTQRINIVANIDTGLYNQVSLGLLSKYASGSEYAYPMFVGGCSSRVTLTNASNAAGWAGPPFAVAQAEDDDYGPCQIYSPGGAWRQVRNGFRSTNSILYADPVAPVCQRIFPPGFYDVDASADIPADDLIGEGTEAFEWQNFASVVTQNQAPVNQPTAVFFPAPGSPERPLLRECVIAATKPDIIAYGEIDGFRWVERSITGGTLSAEDEVVDENGDVWIIFNSGKLTANQHWFAMKMSP
jgi:hypothetical protein